MSAVVDDRIVEMRFDNRDFEQNVRTSMSTLEKLKQSLKFSGASKGLDDMGSAIKKIDMSSLGANVEIVGNKFSVLEQIGIGALRNIGNSAMEVGKKMVSALTIDPVKSGFDEYNTQINAVQTILANTAAEGTTLDQVNRALDELNRYADLTIYNFTEMTRNIGTFTAAGVDLETSVSAIQGIANVAAVSGSTSQQASVAMYQLSQALAAGTVKLQDWNSVVNAGMGGEVFQNALKETSELLGTGAEAAIKAKGSFRESLQTGWLTSQVLTETLKKFTTSGANEYVAKYTGLSKEAVDAAMENAKAQHGEADAIKVVSSELAKQTGKSEEQIASILNMARTAEDAATKVKTIPQLMDTINEAVQSGWTQTWEIIIGDFEEAKELLTSVSDVAQDWVNKISNRRNDILEGAMTSSWDKLTAKINEAGVTTEEFEETTKAALEARGYHVDTLIGEYGSLEAVFRSGRVSTNILQDAIDGLNSSLSNLEGIQETLKDGSTGDDVKKIQEALVSMGYSLDKFGSDGIFGSETVAAVKAFQEAKGLTVDGIIGPDTLAALKEASGTTAKITEDLSGLIAGVDQLGGREALLQSFANIFKYLGDLVAPMKNAWGSIFPPKTTEEAAAQLKGIIDKFHSFTETLTVSDETADKIQRTFKGLFSILEIGEKILTTVASKGFGGLSKVAGMLGFDFLEATAKVGDSIVAFKDFLFTNDLIVSGVDSLGDGVKMSAKAFGELYETVKNLPEVKKFFDDLKNINLEEVGLDIIAGLEKGLQEAKGKIPDVISEIGQDILDAIKGVFGIHAQAAEMETIGEDAVESFTDGIRNKTSGAVDAVKDFAAKFFNAAKSLDWDKIFQVGAISSGITILYKLVNAFDKFGKPFESFGKLLDSAGELLEHSTEKIGKVLGSFSKVLKADAFKLKTEGIRNLAVSLGILAASIYVLAQLDADQLGRSVTALIAVSAVLVGLSIAVSNLQESSASFNFREGFNFKGFNSAIIQIGAAILLIAAAVKLLSGMDRDKAINGFIGLAGIVAAIASAMAVFGIFVHGKSAKNIDKAGKMMKKMAVAMILMVAVLKLINLLSVDEVVKGVAFATGFTLFCRALSVCARVGGETTKSLGGMLVKMAVAMALMVGVVKLINGLSADEMFKGAAFAGAFVIFVALLKKAASANRETEIAKLGGVLMAVSIAMLLMAGVCKIIGTMDASELAKGIVAVTVFGLIIKGLITVVKSSGSEAGKIAGTVLAMSIAIGIMAGVAALLGMLDISALAKGIVAVGLLGGIMTAMIWATRGANDCAKNLFAMSVAIGTIAASVWLLSTLDQAKLYGATTCLSVLMGMFALISGVSGRTDQYISTIIAMTAVVGALAGILYLLQFGNIDASIKNADALSVLLVTLTAAVAVLSKAGRVGKSAYAAIGVMTLVLVGVAAILGAMKHFEVDASIEQAAALSTLLIGLSTAALILSKVGVFGGAAAKGSAALLAVAVGAAAIIAAVAAFVGQIDGIEDKLDGAIMVLEKVGYALGTFFGSMVGGFAAGATSGLPDIAANFTDFINAFSDIDSGALSGVKTLADVIVEITGASILDGIAKFVNKGKSPFEQFADNLEAFGKAIDAISGIASKLDSNSFANLTALASVGSAFAELQKTIGYTDGLVTKIAKKDLGNFGVQIKRYAQQLNIAAAAVREISAEGITNLSEIATVGTAFATLQNNISYTAGLVTILAKKDLGEFGVDIKEYAEQLNIAANSVKTISAEGITNLYAIETLGDAFEKLQNNIAYTDGLVTELADKDLGNFGAQVLKYAANLMIAAAAVSFISAKGLDNLSEIATLGTAFKALQNGIEPTSGFVTLLKDKNLGEFGDTIAEYASQMKTASDGLTGENAIDSEALKTAANIGTLMTDLQKSITKKSWFDGTVDLSKFGTEISNYGSGIKTFSDHITGVDTDKLGKAITIGNRLSLLVFKMREYGADTTAIDQFSDAAATLGTGLSGYYDGFVDADLTLLTESSKAVQRIASTLKITKTVGASDAIFFSIAALTAAKGLSGYATEVAGVDSTAVTTSLDTAKKLSEFINSLSGLNTDGVSKFNESASTLGQTQVSGMLNTLGGASKEMTSAGTSLVKSLSTGITNGDTTKAAMSNVVNGAQRVATAAASSFKAIGAQLSSNFAGGIASGASRVSSAASLLSASAANGSRGHYASMYANGVYLGAGLVAGIVASIPAVYAAGYSLGAAAVRGEKDGQKSKSPSKETIKAGKWLGEGLVIGMNSMSKAVYNAGHTMGESAANSITSYAVKMADIFSQDLDVKPVIAPVVDLSNVKTGIRMANGLLTNAIADTTATVSVMGASVDRRRRADENGELTAAIKKLNNNLGRVGNTYNTIDGITYDNGSQISEAIETIVRAARVERRR